MDIWSGEKQFARSLTQWAPAGLLTAASATAFGIAVQRLIEWWIAGSCGSEALRVNAVCGFQDSHGYWPPVILAGFAASVGAAWLISRRFQPQFVEGTILATAVLTGIVQLWIAVQVWQVQ